MSEIKPNNDEAELCISFVQLEMYWVRDVSHVTDRVTWPGAKEMVGHFWELNTQASDRQVMIL